MKLVVFDLDHTLLKVNSSYRFGNYLFRQNYFSFLAFIKCLAYYARHKLLGLSIEKLHYKTFSALFKGRSLQDLQKHVDRFLNETLETMLYPPVYQRLQEAQERGEYTLILSSSPDFLVGPIAKRLATTDWKATVYQPDEEGNLSCLSSILEGEKKAQHVRLLSSQLGLDQASVTVYSDSILDLPVLKIAGRAIGVVPDFQLKQICQEKGWEIL